MVSTFELACMPEDLRQRTSGFVLPYGMAVIYSLEHSASGLAKIPQGTPLPPQPTKVHAASDQIPARE